MDTTQRVRMMWRYSFLTATFFALFWTVWCLVVGSVPTVKELNLAENCIYILPFGISRWWDVLTGTIWTAVFIWLITNPEFQHREDIVVVLIIFLVVGLGLGLFVGPIFVLVFGLTCILAVTLIFVLIGALITLLHYFFSNEHVKNWLVGK